MRVPTSISRMVWITGYPAGNLPSRRRVEGRPNARAFAGVSTTL
jgi:hypothetical protein